MSIFIKLNLIDTLIKYIYILFLKYFYVFLLYFSSPQEIMAQEEILRKEKELDSARKKLAEIRKARYKDKGPEDGDSSSSF